MKVVNRVKEVFRSENNKVFTGVCGALARRFGCQVALLRVIAVLLFLNSAGLAILFYIGLTIAIPKRHY